MQTASVCIRYMFEIFGTIDCFRTRPVTKHVVRLCSSPQRGCRVAHALKIRQHHRPMLSEKTAPGLIHPCAWITNLTANVGSQSVAVAIINCNANLTCHTDRQTCFKLFQISRDQSLQVAISTYLWTVLENSAPGKVDVSENPASKEARPPVNKDGWSRGMVKFQKQTFSAIVIYTQQV